MGGKSSARNLGKEGKRLSERSDGRKGGSAAGNALAANSRAR
jgi:hypothetical protein